MINRRRLIQMGGLSLTGCLWSGNVFAKSEDDDVWQTQIIDQINNLPNKPKLMDILVPDGCQQNLKPLISTLAKKTNIKLRPTITPVDDINTELLLASGESGKPYDMALSATFGLPDLAAYGVIQPLDEFASLYEPEGFQDDNLYTFGDYFDGKFFGYQTDGDIYLMFFNKGWLEDTTNQERYADLYGKQLQIPQTWQELDQQMRFFHEPEKQQYGGALFRSADYLVGEWWARFHAKGYFPMTDNLEPQIDNEAGIEALDELIAATQYLSPGSRTNGLFENWREYAQGNCYCNIGWGGTQKFLNSPESAMQENLLFAPTPGGEINGNIVRTSYFNWGWNYTVPTNARHPEAAYLCSLLAVTPYMSTMAIREDGYFDPFRQCHYSDPDIEQMYSREFLTVHQKSMSESIPDFYLIGQARYMNSMKTYLNRAVERKMTPSEAMKSVANVWRGLNKQADMQNQKAHWLRVKNGYSEQLRHQLK